MNKQNCNAQQKGITTLATTVILLLVSTLLVFAVATSAIFDQKDQANELRTKELYEIAKDGLENGLAQLKTGDITWVDTDGDGSFDDTGSTATPDNAITNTTSNSGNTYGVTVNLTRLTDADPGANRDKPILLASSTASPTVGDTHISRTVSTLVLRADIINTGLGSAGPILLDGDMTDTKGTVEIVPGPNGVSVTTLDNSGTATIDVDDPASAVETHGGTSAVATNTGPPIPLYQAMFGVPTQNALDTLIRQLAQEDSRIYYMEGDYNLGNLPSEFDSPTDLADGTVDLSDIDKQHIVYFPPSAGCPKLNGNPNIVGLVYISTPDCNDQGWGGCNVYGTVAFTGDVNDMNANCQFIGLDLGDLFEDINDKSAVVSAIPGTWKDF